MYLPRSRSPVMSLRTQPEEEGTLRAEIEAASRTQHELLPRYSWHSSFLKRDHNYDPKQPYRSLLRKDLPPSQLARPFEIDQHHQHDRSIPESYGRKLHSEPSFSSTAESRGKSWRKFRRGKRFDAPPSTPPETTHLNNNSERLSDWPESAPSVHHQPFRMEVDECQNPRYTQFKAWSEDKTEEHSNLGEPPRIPCPKPRRTMKSVYGSLSKTKSFFRSASKNSQQEMQPNQKPNSLATLYEPIPPHLDDFETKDRLLEYLSNNSIISPLSPIDQLSVRVRSTQELQPFELSAGPSAGLLPAELEGTSPGGAGDLPTVESRTSTPSIRDLPPYVEGMRLWSDTAKETSVNRVHSESRSCEAYTSGALYVCNSCQKHITSQEVFDFCSICDIGNRVLCIACAERGPCCQHELEERLRLCSLGQTTALPVTSRSRSSEAETRSSSQLFSSSKLQGADYSSPHRNMVRDNTAVSHAEAPANQPATRDNHSDSHCGTGASLGSLQNEFRNEISSIRKEQDLAHRERELVLREREIALRDQQTILREWEAIVQQKSDLLMRNLETLVSYQELARTAFTNVQVQTRKQFGMDKSCTKDIPSSDANVYRVDPVHSTSWGGPKKSDTLIANIVAHVSPSVKNLNVNASSHIRTCMAQKRKNDSTGGSARSTPPESSSPQQSRKSLSRNNSERDISQDEEEDGDDDRRRSNKKSKQVPSTPNGPQLLFACPYTKHEPGRFSSLNVVEKNYRGCDGHFLTNVSRLKQHLRRVHWQPETYCPRCFEEFENTAGLSEHAQAAIACPARDCPFPEKMDKSKQDKVHVKRPRVPPATVWYDIYKVLFPGAPLPESPYVERNDTISTPSSATPPFDVNLQASQRLSDIFNHRLNQFEELQNSALRPLIDQALNDSFVELLRTFSLSPTASPRPGPSIVVSPVSKPLSDTIRTDDSPCTGDPQAPAMLRQRSVTQVISQPQQVPRLQHPRPPRLQLNTALQVPQDDRRSPSGQEKHSSPLSSSPADVIFDINILPHIREDRGYDDECHSFEQGDDEQAMAFVNEPAPPSWRNKSVISIDSGYGSGRSQQHPNIEAPKPGPSMPVDVDSFTTSGAYHDDYNNFDFQSYSNYLDPMSQTGLDGIDYSFTDPNNPWS